MAYLPISNTVIQYVDGTGTPYNGAVLKAYQAGTSTVLPMATDSTGGTLASSMALNSDGYVTVSGNIILPHVNADFKLALYPTQAAADSNTGAIWNPDNITFAEVPGIKDESNAIAAYIDSSENVIIGGAGAIAPDTVLHVYKGSAGSVTASINAALTVEDSSDTWINLLSPSANLCGLLFGDPSQVDVGLIRYNHADDSMSFWTNNSEQAQMDANGNVIVGTAALATTATDGFLYIPTCPGVPTGTPTAKTGRVPMVFDSTNNKFYIYDGSWLSVALT